MVEFLLLIGGWFLWVISSFIAILAIILIIKGLLMIIASLAKTMKGLF